MLELENSIRFFKHWVGQYFVWSKRSTGNPSASFEFSTSRALIRSPCATGAAVRPAPLGHGNHSRRSAEWRRVTDRGGRPLTSKGRSALVFYGVLYCFCRRALLTLQQTRPFFQLKVFTGKLPNWILLRK